MTLYLNNEELFQELFRLGLRDSTPADLRKVIEELQARRREQRFNPEFDLED